VKILGLFCGAGGSSDGIRRALPGVDVQGVDLDPDACATHEAAGFPTLQADLTDLDASAFGPVDGLWASPPCTDFSQLGARRGVDGPTGALIYAARDWAVRLWPDWVVFEQVPPVLPYWQRFAAHLGTLGYWTWAGLLNAADYGVPQTRSRAFLLASRTGPVRPPAPTHEESPSPHPRLFDVGRPSWVTMAAALSWPPLDPSDELRRWCYERPATTVMGDRRVFPPEGHHPEQGRGHASNRAVKVTPVELAALQGFPPGYPFKGSAASVARQIGNAVPPALAAVCVRAVRAPDLGNHKRVSIFSSVDHRAPGMALPLVAQREPVARLAEREKAQVATPDDNATTARARGLELVRA
jgi:DNA (cytosine-5)-methyltransferase 1